MDTYFFFLGSNPALSAAELWSVLYKDGLTPNIITSTAEYLVLKFESELPDTLLPRLGGIDRIARLLGTFDHEPTPKEILDLFSPLPTKWSVGLSVVGTSLNIKSVLGDLKKLARDKDSRMKFSLPTSGSRLNAAQVLFNGLYREPNAEITLLKTNDAWHVLRTIAVQDIQAYEKRDTARVSLDQKVGMLPPKLAQIMINLTVNRSDSDTPVILDPFCGMGTVVQESWLMGYQAVGSDVSKRMIKASRDNLQQLALGFEVDEKIQPELLTHDSRSPYPADWSESFDVIVTEPYMGEARSEPLSPAEYKTVVKNLVEVYVAAFRNLHSVLKKDGFMLFILPSFRVDGRQGYTPLSPDLLDEIEAQGYSKVQLVPKEVERLYGQSDRGTLLYHRQDAYVARELTLWQKV